jgi:glyoxylase-like metal-dependent hydrolase (beta-lactamase superfamily II)
MEVHELAPGLWRWTAWHDEARRKVGCVYYECGGEVCLVDPLVPPEDPAGFWAALDRDVARLGGSVRVLLTGATQTRSARELVERYEAQLWAPGDPLPDGIGAFDAGRSVEVVFWLPEPRALVAGDAIVGDGRGGVRLDDRTRREALQPLLELDVELILVSQGEPVLARGGEVLSALLG